jgi:hypothetical protein
VLKEFTVWFRSCLGQGYVSQGHRVCVKANSAFPQRERDAAEEGVRQPLRLPFLIRALMAIWTEVSVWRFLLFKFSRKL